MFCNTRGDDQRDHAGAVPPGRLQRLDQLLHLPDLHILVSQLWGVTHCGKEFFFKEKN